MHLSGTYLPADISRIILVYAGNPALTSKVNQQWRQLSCNEETLKALLQAYKMAMGVDAYGKFLNRSGIENLKIYINFTSHLKHQWSVLKYCTNGQRLLSKRFASEKEGPASVRFIKAIEEYLTKSEEIDLYQFSILLLDNPNVQLDNEKFYDAYRLIIEQVKDPKHYIRNIAKHHAGTQLWKILSSHFDLSLIKVLIIGFAFFGVPPQIGTLSGLKVLKFVDDGKYSLPVELEKLTQLENLDLGNNSKFIMSKKLRESTHGVIRKAFSDWKAT